MLICQYEDCCHKILTHSQRSLKTLPSKQTADWRLKILQSSQNSTFAYFSMRRLLMQNFNPFGETVKNYPQNNLAERALKILLPNRNLVFACLSIREVLMQKISLFLSCIPSIPKQSFIRKLKNTPIESKVTTYWILYTKNYHVCDNPNFPPLNWHLKSLKDPRKIQNLALAVIV